MTDVLTESEIKNEVELYAEELRNESLRSNDVSFSKGLARAAELTKRLNGNIVGRMIYNQIKDLSLEEVKRKAPKFTELYKKHKNE